jgi:N-acetylmuramic acid 6-phosphate etherase
LAGYDRPKVADPVNSALIKLFDRPINDSLRISTDIELLVTPSANEHRLDSVVVLVVGTGSVAMSYRRDAGRFIRTGRSGGWGNFLGDDGSGYGIGREGLRMALETADEMNLRQEGDQTTQDINPLAAKIFEHFEMDRQAGTPVDLLNRILTPDHSDDQDASTLKRTIAGVSRIVLDESFDNDKAKAIVQAGGKSLVRILSLLIENRAIDPSNSALILAGGMMQNETYRSMVLDGLSSSGKQFRYIQAIDQPAINAARYLL